jgi:hypothetical protein
MSDHRRKQALTEGMDIMAVIMSEIRMLAVVRSTVWLGRVSVHLEHALGGAITAAKLRKQTQPSSR